MPLASLPIRTTTTRHPLAHITKLCFLSRAPLRLWCLEQRRVHSTRRKVVPIRRGQESAVEKFLKRVRIMGGQDDHHHHGHGHGHDHGDVALLMSKDSSNPGVRITRVGLYSPPSPPTLFLHVSATFPLGEVGC
jgi:hypothetical protein